MNTSCDVMSVRLPNEALRWNMGVFLPWIQINSWFGLAAPGSFPD
ncbi:MAG: hypothetical protein ACLR8Y_09130 [Alistipes indistinctus]